MQIIFKDKKIFKLKVHLNTPVVVSNKNNTKKVLMFVSFLSFICMEVLWFYTFITVLSVSSLVICSSMHWTRPFSLSFCFISMACRGITKRQQTDENLKKKKKTSKNRGKKYCISF